MTYTELVAYINQCKKCELCKDKGHHVPGTGSMSSGIMIVGEGPGARESELGLPFVGPAGDVLDEVLHELGRTRNEFYITNVVKCRPPENRTPSDAEILACQGYLKWQVSLLKPKMILCLGNTSAKSILDPKFTMSKQHGQVIKRKNLMIAATYHPAAVLYNPVLKRTLITDLDMILKYYNEELAKVEQ